MSGPRAYTLGNGLTVLIWEQHTVPVVTLWVWYRVGSRNEVPGLTGISHWVEHMLFKGTPARPRTVLTRLIDRLGGRWNAFTWKDYTAYHEVLPAGHLEEVVAMEADRMAHTVFDPEEVERERTVIISEREGSENFPAYLLREEVDAAAHKVHPYRIPVIGWKEDLRAISRDDLVAHYRTYYHPNNAVVVVVGACEERQALESIRRAFEPLPPGPPPPPVRAREPRQEGERRVVLRRPGGATAYLHVAFHAPAASHPDLPALLVADGILSGFKSLVPFDQPSGGRSSRLYRALVDTGLASEVSSSLIPSLDPTLFRITATARAGVDVAAVEDRVREEVARLAAEPVTPDELARAKKQARAQFVYSRDGVFRQALALGAFALVDTADAFLTLLSRIDAVTAEDVMRVAATYFTDRARTTGWYLPEPAVAAGPVPAARPAVFHRTDPEAGVATPPITPDAVTRVALPSGAAVLVRDVPGSGSVAVQGYVRAGAMCDGDRPGLARFAAAMLSRGTRSWTSQGLAELLDGLGAGLSVRADLETVSVGLRVLAEDVPTVLPALAEILTAPTFPADEVEKVRGELLTALRVSLQDTRHVAERLLRALLYPPGHPQRRVPDGEEAAVEAITRDDVACFHRLRFRPDGAVLAVVGDCRAGEVVDLLHRLLEGWLPSGSWQPPAVPPPAAGGPRRAEQRMPGKVQSDLAVGVPGIARTDPAYYETMVANLILGQLGLMGRLGERVREQQGMAYYAFSELRAGLLAGPWLVRAGVNPANEQAALEAILAEIRRFQRDGPDPEELADARQFLIGSLAVRLETLAGIAQVLADIELFGLGLDYLVRYPQIIGAVDAEAVVRAARAFSPDACAVAVAGPPLPP
ncbi:MAG: pitrilysin family protein [Armatimonadota bacterium]|nr:pitrilysin family protein [Armatimonadota bacterium]MDR7436884.1 pitrilysin family protein [Armatimonadota bacterium]MDR7471575.1 pitrilysin family protein [Armatimonadota bacterium]MDR7507577.1 pitrilysin family protein [Armatimonadota bacterium]MDR7509507.1 pitrilysin family protein [Armatimonadota bacterium]